MRRTLQCFSVALAVAASSAINSPAVYAGVMDTIIKCEKKDAIMFDKIGSEIKSFNKKIGNTPNTIKDNPEKYCSWLKEVVLPFRERHQHILDARMDDSCGPDPIIEYALFEAIDSVKRMKRKIDSVCAGVKEY